MTEDKLAALRRMVKDRTNIEESRNALLQLLKRNAITPDEVMEFVDAYEAHKKAQAIIELPDSLQVFIAVNYSALRDSLAKGYQYLPMLRTNDWRMQTDDEIFEIRIPLKARARLQPKSIEGKRNG